MLKMDYMYTQIVIHGNLIILYGQNCIWVLLVHSQILQLNLLTTIDLQIVNDENVPNRHELDKSIIHLINQFQLHFINYNIVC